MNSYNTPMITQVNSVETEAIKPGVAVPVIAIYALALTTVAASVQFAVQMAAVMWNATWVWNY
ncbi:hypothetical protein M2651_07290 [Clostridium sp. SYSU_GA19001]|uniref:hypothetical protein n=1 Tax=Clostridium caldaquaticum TaxID=2940653 RepID=UPI00207732F1|nr:hypothetical protein [Clostridium caldaquaticum]MCM8710830.1 hypothetical protein [Clostridium caldaquaticum]